MTTRARLEDPDVGISDILAPQEESLWRLGGVEYRLHEREGLQGGWQYGLVIKKQRLELIRIVGSVSTEVARKRLWYLGLRTSHRKFPRRATEESTPLTPDERRARLDTGRAAAAKRRQAKAVAALEKWRRKLALAKTKVKRYERAVKRMIRTV